MSTKTQYLVQEMRICGMITFWIMIISSFLEFCYIGIITRFIGFIFLGLTLYKISLLVEDKSIINIYLLLTITLFVPIISLLFASFPIFYVGKKTGVNEFVRTAKWWVASLLLPANLCLFLLPFSSLPESLDPFHLLWPIGLLLTVLTKVVIEIYAMLQWRAGLQRIAEMFTHEDGLVQS